MKEFRKNSEDLLICEECEKTFKSLNGLSQHIFIKHMQSNEYYNKWIKTDDDGICKICGHTTKCYGLNGYKNYCCDECSKKLHYINLKLSNLEKYGVENVFQSKYSKEKSKQTKLKKYGNENYRNPEKFKQTCLEKYGVQHISQLEEIKERKKQTCLKNYGVEAGFADIKKREQTCLEHFGVQNPSQDIEIHKKQQHSGFQAKKFRNTDLYYRGKFELDFLEKVYDRYPEMINAYSIKYIFNNKNKVYYPDFYIKSLNLIIEIKSTRTIELQGIKRIVAKKMAAINNGFNYIVIINKKYDKFNKLYLK